MFYKIVHTYIYNSISKTYILHEIKQLNKCYLPVQSFEFNLHVIKIIHHKKYICI